MSKVAIQLDDSRKIIGYASENTAEAQSQFEGWILVDNDPAFLVGDMYFWTVRESDNKLVHIATGMTPDEETNSVSAATLKQVGAVSAQVNNLATAFGAYMKATASSDASTTTEEGTK
ncbi:hypothetical protein [Companilactobacillus hulinensis]|uniref:hypothetical protein n=1 Tax=Companilactobacillus hulinensis TaxID=2486007 RepID=UPI000F784788|nr:hypothetical protein [Companilactobacillus hulinensis]